MKTGRDKFQKFKIIIDILCKIFRIFPNLILVFIWNTTTNHNQLLFILLRYIIAKNLLKNCGDNVRFGPNIQIIGWKKLEIGSNVSIHANSYIDASGGIKIGSNVSIAHNSTILSSNHDWKDINLPIKYNPLVFKSVSIDEDVWIGCACRILAGVNIKSRAIVAAGAIVNTNVESNTIVGGIPAKLIKKI